MANDLNCVVVPLNPTHSLTLCHKLLVQDCGLFLISNAYLCLFLVYFLLIFWFGYTWW